MSAAFHLRQDTRHHDQPRVNYSDIISEIIALSNPHIYTIGSGEYMRSLSSIKSQVQSSYINDDDLRLYRDQADTLSNDAPYDIRSDTDELLDILLRRTISGVTDIQRIFTVSITKRSSSITPEVAVLISNTIHLHSEIPRWTLRSMHDTLSSHNKLSSIFHSISISRRTPKSFTSSYILFEIDQPDRRDILGRYVYVSLKSTYTEVF